MPDVSRSGSRVERAWWPGDVDTVLGGDLTAAAAYVTPAGGAVVTGVAPCGMRDRERGTVGYTTSLGFGRKLGHILRDPHVALAYHSREHGFASSSHFVSVQGTASVDLTPSRQRLESFVPVAERFLGEVQRGLVWDRLLRAYYYERVFIDIAVERVVVWPDLAGWGEAVVYGSSVPIAPDPQIAPARGTTPRVDMAKVAGQLSSLPHRVLAYRGSDGFPVVVPIEFAGHDRTGFRLIAASGLLPAGGRRAGLLAHAYHAQLIGLSTRSFTGWLEVASDGAARYAPHTSVGFFAPPNKRMLLVANGLLAAFGIWRARRHGTAAELERLAAQREAHQTSPKPAIDSGSSLL
jgi:hypothetical protein